MENFLCDHVAIKALIYISVPIVLWLIIGIVVAYIGHKRDEKAENEIVKFED